MKTIYKYPLKNAKNIPLPAHFEIVHVGHDPSGSMCMWVVVETKLMTRDYDVAQYGTGWDLPPDHGQFLYTEIDGPFVWHYFLVKSNED